jgi:hypothetical protein
MCERKALHDATGWVLLTFTRVACPGEGGLACNKPCPWTNGTKHPVPLQIIIYAYKLLFVYLLRSSYTHRLVRYSEQCSILVTNTLG